MYTHLFYDILMNISEKKEIVELMKCIWVYSDNHGKRCKVCRLYKNWAIEALEKKMVAPIH